MGSWSIASIIANLTVFPVPNSRTRCLETYPLISSTSNVFPLYFLYSHVSIRQHGFRPYFGDIVVEEDVWIGANCVLLDGAVLRRGCVIDAASLERGEVPAYSIPAGNSLKLKGWCT